MEPCHQYLVKHGDGYGLGRNVLPQNIAIPLCKLAARLGMRPFMEYATSYAYAPEEREEKEYPVMLTNPLWRSIVDYTIGDGSIPEAP